MRNNWFSYILLIIFIAYITILFMQGHDPIADFTLQKYGNAFVIASVLSLINIALQLYKKQIIHRLALGLNLFVFIGAVTFLGNISSISYCYDVHTGLVLWACIFFVGIITTFYTRAGFIGVASADVKDVYIASLKLLLVTMSYGLWSLWMRQYYPGVSSGTILPFVIFDSLYHRWGKQLRGEKVSTFKWKY